MNSKFVCSILLLFLFIRKEISSEKLVVDCIDSLTDFENAHWLNNYNDFTYVETSHGLPGVLQDKFEGKGIFYAVASFMPKIILKDPKSLQSGPTVVYVKYYNHVAKSDVQLSFVTPVQGTSIGLKILNSTSNFEWAEGFVRIEEESMQSGVRVGSMMEYEDIFIVDRIILAQGEGLDKADMEFVKSLCWSDSEEFVCERPGNFADPNNCSIFHVCQVDQNGNSWDTVLTCPEKTVWCQEKGWCEHPDICQCSNNLINS